MADAQKTVQDVTTAVENAWNTVRRAARSVSLLYARGAATCQDVKTYNLLALSVYESQKAMLEFFRGQGITGLPALPPTPTLFSWKGTAGKDTVLLDCSTQLNGPLAAAAPIPVGALSVTTAEPDYMNPQIAVFDFQKKDGLGLALIIYLVIAGVGFAAGLGAVLAFASALESRSEQKRMMFEIEQKAKIALKLYDARNSCMASCTTKDSNEFCFDKCVKLIPQVDVSATPPSKWNLWALIGLGAVGAAVGVALYVKVKGSHNFAGYFGDGDGDGDGDEGDEDEDEDELGAPKVARPTIKALAEEVWDSARINASDTARENGWRGNPDEWPEYEDMVRAGIRSAVDDLRDDRAAKIRAAALKLAGLSGHVDVLSGPNLATWRAKAA